MKSTPASRLRVADKYVGSTTRSSPRSARGSRRLLMSRSAERARPISDRVTSASTASTRMACGSTPGPALHGVCRQRCCRRAAVALARVRPRAGRSGWRPRRGRGGGGGGVAESGDEAAWSSLRASSGSLAVEAGSLTDGAIAEILPRQGLAAALADLRDAAGGAWREQRRGAARRQGSTRRRGPLSRFAAAAALRKGGGIRHPRHPPGR